MGQKQSSTASWTIDDWAFGTGQNAVQLEDVIDGAKEIPKRYFGGQALATDPSINQMQNDLLAFDDKLLKIFRRKKNKKSKKQKASYEYDTQDQQQYYDQNQYAIPEEDENHLPPIYGDDKVPEEDESSLPPIYANDNEQRNNAKSSWKCRYCKEENKSTAIQCHQCRQLPSAV